MSVTGDCNCDDVQVMAGLKPRVKRVGEVTDYSSFIQQASQSQLAIPYREGGRQLLILANPDPAITFYYAFDREAEVAKAGSIPILPGDAHIYDGSFVPNGDVRIIAATVNALYTAKDA